ncbi:MAG: FAD:protein FMN transferase [Ardenticatenaceae bacterium]|nr:FAD:protein FMN transferase [Ardenticatenaceae bacterium]
MNLNLSISPTVTRRDMLKITAVAGTLVVGGKLASTRWLPRSQTIHETRTLMGTVINLALVTDDKQAGQAVIEATFAEMERLIALFDHRHPEAQLAILNCDGKLSQPAPELVDLMNLALSYGRLTNGAFDVTVKPIIDALKNGGSSAEAAHLVNFRWVSVNSNRITFAQPGMAVTLDGIAKGRVVDGAVAVLQANNFGNILVEAGGDLWGQGLRLDGAPWRVGVANPRPAAETGVLAIFPVAAQAAATSGDYQNSFTPDFGLHHIVDPVTAVSPLELASATVIAPSAADADALSTALMVMGPDKGLALAERLPHVEALLVGKDLQIYRSSGFPTLE